MQPPAPILVTHLFPETLAALLDLLSGLSAEEWRRPTICAQWSVKDIALHLLGGEIGILSRKRDGQAATSEPITSWDELVAFINRLNHEWVQATRRLSPRVLCDLLRLAGTQSCEYFRSLDPHALGEPVDWAGPDPAPVWLDLAREHTERWHHQQQIRDAVGRPGLKEPKFFAPVLDAFVRALPHTFSDVAAQDGAAVALTITGEAGSRWLILREQGRWHLYLAPARNAQTEVMMDQETAWRLFTKGISRHEAQARATITGEPSLGLKLLETVSVIA
jgi:uncharacterized protein (TIGR03083 family)